MCANGAGHHMESNRKQYMKAFAYGIGVQGVGHTNSFFIV